MSISDLMQAMASAGAPMEAIVLAVRALEEKDALIEARRAGDRERKRRQRESGTVTGQSRDSVVTVTATPSLDKEKGTQKEINPTPAHTRTRGAGVWACPEGVNPDHWNDFLQNRKRKRLVNTETARSGVMTALESKSDARWTPALLVKAAAEKGWGSIVYPDDDMFATGRRNDRTAQAPTSDTLSYLSTKYRPAA